MARCPLRVGRDHHPGRRQQRTVGHRRPRRCADPTGTRCQIAGLRRRVGRGGRHSQAWSVVSTAATGRRGTRRRSARGGRRAGRRIGDLMETTAEFGRLAMFPLQSAFLPGEDLPLQIFEPRYAELVRDCMRDNNPRFGVVLISQGREVGGGDVPCDVGTAARGTECDEVAGSGGMVPGSGRLVRSSRKSERIKVCEWLPDNPFPRAVVEEWPDEPGKPVSAGQLEELEDRMMALFERIANARDLPVPDREEVLGAPTDTDEPGERLYALASRIPIGPADRYAVLAAPTAAERLTALNEAVDSVAAVIEFQLSE